MQLQEVSIYRATVAVAYEDAKVNLKMKKRNFIVEAATPEEVGVLIANRMKEDESDYELKAVVSTNFEEIIKRK